MIGVENGGQLLFSRRNLLQNEWMGMATRASIDEGSFLSVKSEYILRRRTRMATQTEGSPRRVATFMVLGCWDGNEAV